MIIKKKLQLEALLFFVVGAAVGFFALQSQNTTPVTLTSKAAEPASTSNVAEANTVSPTPIETTSSQISSDGTKKVIMHVSDNTDGSRTYDLATSDHPNVIFAKLLQPRESLEIPFNTWSANNSYFFMQENATSGTKIYVFRGNGEPFAGGELFIDVTAIFENSPRRSSNDTFYEATGWAESNLLIINTKRSDGKQGASYWFEVPSKNIYRLAHQF